MASYPVQPMYDAYGKPLGHPENPHAGYPMAPQYSGMPPQYAVMQPGPYPPQMMDPAYGQGNMWSAVSEMFVCLFFNHILDATK